MEGAFYVKKREEEKLKAVLRVVKKNMIDFASARILGCDESVVRIWTSLYNEHGLEGLSKHKLKYNGEFKLNVIKYMYENHLSYRAVAAKFGIKSHETVRKREDKYYEKGPKSFCKKTYGRPIEKVDIKNLETEKKKNRIVI